MNELKHWLCLAKLREVDNHGWRASSLSRQLSRISKLPNHGYFTFLWHDVPVTDTYNLNLRIKEVLGNKPVEELKSRLHCIRKLPINEIDNDIQCRLPSTIKSKVLKYIPNSKTYIEVNAYGYYKIRGID